MELLKDKRLQLTLGTAVIVMISVVGFALNISTRFERIEATQRQLKDHTETCNDRYETVANKQALADLDRVKILTKLESIEASILELKVQLKEHDK